jgi:hypothetical protein
MDTYRMLSRWKVGCVHDTTSRSSPLRSPNRLCFMDREYSDRSVVSSQDIDGISLSRTIMMSLALVGQKSTTIFSVKEAKFEITF